MGTWRRQLRLTRLSHGCSANLKVSWQSDIPLVVPDPALHPASLGFEETKCPRIASLKERTSFQSFWGSESKSPDEFRDKRLCRPWLKTSECGPELLSDAHPSGAFAHE